MRVELVIARYNESLDWLDNLLKPKDLVVMVYNKGDRDGVPPDSIGLENVGREGHTYLWHIVNRYDTLTDWTVFSQANPEPHLMPDAFCWLLMPMDWNRMGGPIVCWKEWDDEGRLTLPPIWDIERQNGDMKRSRWTMREWFREFVGMDLPEGGLRFTSGACFGVPASMIRSRPLEYYQRLLDTVSHDINPEEGHYLERAWRYIFGAEPCPTR